jgi:hypothetical protein
VSVEVLTIKECLEIVNDDDYRVAHGTWRIFVLQLARAAVIDQGIATSISRQEDEMNFMTLVTLRGSSVVASPILLYFPALLARVRGHQGEHRE